MKRHDFAELTDYEFEALTRDLLTRELGVRLELFTPGRDKGIDLRHLGSGANGKPDVVVQCKHFAAHAWSELQASAKKERPKLDRLKPKRYILVTSVQLTPARKDDLVADLSPYILSAGDIIGRDDLTGLLVQHGDIERRHVKLWLTGTEVLDALLNSDVMNRSEAVVERTRRQLRLWVPNASFERAKILLEKHHLALIAGKPGIGKTMLADVLVADFVAREWELVSISADIEEGLRAWRSDRKQIFLYDDFLGQVSAGELSLRKNEDNDLAIFIARVVSSPTKRMILTTREYILAEARSRYERLDSQPFAAWQCVLSLDDYTRFIRAKILYNHLYFSELAPEFKSAIVDTRAYMRIIDHRSYLPRLIEQAIDLPQVKDLDALEFPGHLLGMLDDPSKVWERIYSNLPSIARDALLALATLPSEVLLDDLVSATESLIGNTLDPVKWNDALRLLDGTFVRVEANGERRKFERVIAFRDPSVRDYLRSRVRSYPGEARRLVVGARFFEQCLIVHDSLKGVPPEARSQESRLKNLTERALTLLDSADPSLTNYADGPEQSAERWRARRGGPHTERRLGALLKIAQADADAVALVIPAIEQLEYVWLERAGDKEEALALLGLLPSVGVQTEQLLSAISEWFEATLTSFEDWQLLLELDASALQSGGPSRQHMAAEFIGFVESERDWLLWDCDDSAHLDQELDRMIDVAKGLGVDLGELPERVRNRYDELLRDEPGDVDDDDDHRASRFDDGNESEIDGLFESLRDR